MEKKQFIAAGILTLAFVGLVFAVELTPKSGIVTHSDVATAIISELEQKIDVQEKLIIDLRKQLKHEKEKNRKLLIVCDKYNVPRNAYRALFGPKKQIQDGAMKVPLYKNGKPRRLEGLSLGNAGWVKGLKIRQIVDDTNAIVIHRYYFLNDEGVLIHSEARQTTVWLKGISTEGAADDSRIKINQMMKITGTTSYKTTDGSKKTLFVMEPVPYYFPKGYSPGKKLRKR